MPILNLAYQKTKDILNGVIDKNLLLLIPILVLELILMVVKMELELNFLLAELVGEADHTSLISNKYARNNTNNNINIKWISYFTLGSIYQINDNK
ncbi:MAG: hypothetical protein EBR82_68650 [Caulobacteraceae bacterium]|nr:hypothetical protein [Caulobacteraceae bacterium]